MRFPLLLLALALPAAAWAQTRTLTVSAPSQVYAGESFTASSSASTSAGGGEQIGFYHGQYSTDGGSSWTWFTSDVNVGTSATRNAYITAGAAGSTVVVRARLAFRDGAAGDVDYDGNAIDWGGSWDTYGIPPAKYAYISVVAPPNHAPTIAWTQAPGSAWVNQWFSVQARGNDANGNLSSVSVWKEWVPFAFNGGGNGWESYSDANMASGSAPTTIAFQAQSGDGGGLYSGVIYHNVQIINRYPHVAISASPTTIAFGQTTNVTSVATDPDSNLGFHGILLLNEAQDNWYRPSQSDHSTGWGNHPATNTFTYVSYTSGTASGGSNTRNATHRPAYAGVMTYHANTHDGHVWASSDATNWANCIGYASVTVNKATPAGTFANRTISPAGASYTVQASDLNAAFANPYSSGVAVPTGSITYSIVSGGSGSVTPGTQLSAGTVYTIRATHSGDTNYNVGTVDAVWTLSAAPTYTLTVENGTGSVSGVTLGTVHAISAGPPPLGQVFGNWTIVSGVGSIANATAANTTFTMGSGNATVRANFGPFDPNGDEDGDGVPNGLELELGTSPYTASVNDASNQTQLNVHEPSP